MSDSTLTSNPLAKRTAMVEVAGGGKAPRLEITFETLADMQAASDFIRATVEPAAVPDVRGVLRRVVEAVQALGAMEDGKTLFEANPSKSKAAFDAWLALNEAVAKANYVLERPAEPPSSDQYTIEPHGDGHALYSGRDSTHHGFNLAHITEATPEVLKLIEDALNARVAQLPSDPYELGIKRTWEMADPLRPPGQPGSYARGYHNGIVDALHQLRANIDAEKSRAEGAQPTSSVTEAAKALVLKLKQIEDHPSYQSVWVMAGNRGIPYTGPNYAGELQSLKEALGMYAETKEATP